MHIASHCGEKRLGGGRDLAVSRDLVSSRIYDQRIMVIKWILIYLLAINVIAFCSFGWDKLCAQKGWWRVRERTLLDLSLLGGSIGAVFGQQFFRHKTQKKSFRSRLINGIFIQVLIAGVAVILVYVV